MQPLNAKTLIYFRHLCILMIAFLALTCKKDKKENVTPTLQTVADGLVSPIAMAEAPDGSNRLFIVDQIGKIWIIGADGNKMANPFIDLSGKMVTLTANYDERGLLGFAFHPDYRNNGRFFVYYNAPPRTGIFNNLSRISEFKVSTTNANAADMNTEKILIEMDDPQSNHNGGTLAFGPDGYLYISIGDGGGANDNGTGHVPDWYTVNNGGNGQDIYANFFGDILRINVNSGNPYSIPADNPFVGGPGLDEIYAYGFRNPYRMSFDMGGTNQLYVGDAGQVLFEEIDIVTKGGNYGWNVKEGTHCFNTTDNKVERTTCPSADTSGRPLTDPIIELKNVNNPTGGIATTIVGGNVYRGTELPDFVGKYIFGVFSTTTGNTDAKIFVGNPANTGLWSYSEISLKDFNNNLGMYLKGFGQDNDGEIYLLTSTLAGPSGTTGKVMKLVGVEE